MDLDNNAHSVFLLHYHLVLVVKYRRQVFDDAISGRAKEIFAYIAPNYNITLEEWNHDKDHVHILSEKRISTDKAKIMERTFLEPEFLPAHNGRCPDGSNQKIH